MTRVLPKFRRGVQIWVFFPESDGIETHVVLSSAHLLVLRDARTREILAFVGVEGLKIDVERRTIRYDDVTNEAVTPGLHSGS